MLKNSNLVDRYNRKIFSGTKPETNMVLVEMTHFGICPSVLVTLEVRHTFI